MVLGVIVYIATYLTSLSFLVHGCVLCLDMVI